MTSIRRRMPSSSREAAISALLVGRPAMLLIWTESHDTAPAANWKRQLQAVPCRRAAAERAPPPIRNSVKIGTQRRPYDAPCILTCKLWSHLTHDAFLTRTRDAVAWGRSSKIRWADWISWDVKKRWSIGLPRTALNLRYYSLPLSFFDQDFMFLKLKKCTI